VITGKKLPSAFYNPLSMLGAILALVSFCVILFLLLLDFFSEASSPYMGILAFIILPSVLVFGLVAIPIGMFLERKRRQKAEYTKRRSFYVDFDKASHRTASMIFLIGSVIFLLATAVGSYRAYEFTESNTFCGELCHSVMKPEFVAYQNSSHARVNCVECHVGEGADWYVRSKLAGSYQLYSVLFNKFETPIPTPVENLRPARETCQHCHWPDKFHGSRERVFNHFMVDEENTPWTIRMLMKTGGGANDLGEGEGIHWHINAENSIEYYALDEKRQEIAWVRFRDEKGAERVYLNEDLDFDSKNIDLSHVRRMDCIDCHNRPAHIYNSPSRSVNSALASGRIDPAAPSAKRIAVEALIGDYTDSPSAATTIENQILEAYQEEYPDYFASNEDKVKKIVEVTKEIYKLNFFPEMKVRWDAYPDNIGHFSSLGCYRCHNGKLVSEEGLAISNDCSKCHTILSQGNGEMSELINGGGIEFKHPVDIDEEWREIACSECHTGTSQL